MSRQVSADGGWWEDARGFVKGRMLRQRYHEAGKALQRAELAVLGCANDDRRKGLEEDLEKCCVAYAEVEKEVKAEDFA